MTYSCDKVRRELEWRRGFVRRLIKTSKILKGYT